MSTPLPSSPMKRELEAARDAFSEVVDAHSKYEEDTGSSSISDYSDSDTQSSESEGEETAETEEDDEDESPPQSPSRRRR